MGAPLLTVSATVMCPHGGQGTIVPSQTAVVAGGNRTVTLQLPGSTL